MNGRVERNAAQGAVGGPGPARTARARGREAEQIAAGYLRLSGYAVLAENVRAGAGEIDLIARRGACLALVEVRWRGTPGQGRPEETVCRRKWQNWRRAAELWLERADLPAPVHLRFDLIAIERDRLGLRLRHLPGWSPPGTQGWRAAR